MATDGDTPHRSDIDGLLHLVLTRSPYDDSFVPALEQLANRGRENLSVRRRLAQPNVLENLLSILQNCPIEPKNASLLRQTLRCVGNASASNPSAVAVVHRIGFAWVHRILSSSTARDLQDLATKVLYNICAATSSSTSDDAHDDGENVALQACLNEGVHFDLIRYLAQSPTQDDADADVVDMLFWITSVETPSDEIQVPEDILVSLTTLPSKYVTGAAPDTLASLLESIIIVFRPAAVQRQIAASPANLASNIFGTLEGLEIRLSELEKQVSRVADRAANADEDTAREDSMKLLLPQSASLTWLLSDISAEPSFPRERGMDDELIHRVMLILRDPAQIAVSERRTAAACLVLGNVLLSLPEAETSTVVAGGAVHANAFSMALHSNATPDLLHAIAGFLTVLCRPWAGARELICRDQNAVLVVNKLCKHDVPQVRDAGVRLLRALGRDSLPNQQRLADVASALGAAMSSTSPAVT